MIKPRALILTGLLLTGTVQAQPLALKDNHPTRYTVRQGDTLWDISAHFLKSPWLWPQLWRANPQVANPHLIYPGDRLTLVWVNGEPRLVRAGDEPAGLVTLSPRIRAESAVATVPLAAIINHTRGQQLFSATELESAPVLLGDRQGRELLRQGELAYANGQLEPGQLYGAYRDMGELTDVRTGESYGRRAVLTGTVSARAQPEPGPNLASVQISSQRREMRPGDRLLPLTDGQALAAFYQPSPGPALPDGRVLAMGHEGRVAARHDVILLNKGLHDGLHPGHLYGVLRPAASLGHEPLTLPPLPVARVMVFQTFEHASAALVLDSREPVHSHYLLGEPEYDEHGR